MKKTVSLDDIINKLDNRCINLRFILESLEPIILNELRKGSNNESKVLKRFNHMRMVAFIAKELVLSLENTNLRFGEETINIVIIGAYLHDIKKFNNAYDSHSNEGADFIQNNNEIYNIIGPYTEIVSEIVRYHKEGYYKNKGNIKIINEKNLSRRIEIKIVQDADKISSIYKEKKDILTEKNKILNKKGLNFKESIEYLNKLFLKI